MATANIWLNGDVGDVGEETVHFVGGVGPSVGTSISLRSYHATAEHLRSEGMETGPATPRISANISHFKLVVLMSWVVGVVGKEVRDERS